MKDSACSPLSAADEAGVVGEFARLWWEKKGETFFCNRFLGVPTLQHPFDAWVTQEIMSEVVPDLVVESGSFCGGSALLWAMLLEQINPAAKIIAIDMSLRSCAVTRRSSAPAVI